MDETLKRAIADLLKYGNHLEGCDRSNEDSPPDVQHICCSCGWCLVVCHWSFIQGPIEEAKDAQD